MSTNALTPQMILSDKNNIARYVSDVADLEKAIFTLDEAAKKIEYARRQEIMKQEYVSPQLPEAYKEKEKEEEELNGKIQKLTEARDEAAKHSFGFRTFINVLYAIGDMFSAIFEHWGIFWLGSVISMFVGGFSWLGYVSLFDLEYDTELDALPWIIITPCITVLILIIIFSRIEGVFSDIVPVRVEKFQKRLDWATAERDALHKELQAMKEQSERDAARATERRRTTRQKACTLYDMQLLKIQNAKRALRVNLQTLYDMNLIGPDYRTFDCALDLDHIFRNGLCDTMQEALNLYNTRVFQGAVLRGIDRIYSMLQELSMTMRHMQQTLEEVRDRVNDISSDVVMLVSNSYDTLDRQKELLEEAKLNRYAAEEISRSQARMEYYVRNV